MYICDCICDIFFEAPGITSFSYTDDNTPYTHSSNTQTVLKILQEAKGKPFQ